MPQQRLDVHQLSTGVEQVGGVGMPQLVRADLLFDARLSDHQPQVGGSGLPRYGFLSDRTGNDILRFRSILEPKPEHSAEAGR